MTDLQLITRRTWGAAARQGSVIQRAPSSITELFVHYPGAKDPTLIPPSGWTAAEERQIMRDLQRGHFANGWSDIGYNHVLFPHPDGLPRIYTARGAQYIPAAQLKHNTGTIAIMVYMGSADMLHDSTKARLRSYVRWADDYAGRRLRVRGHGEVVQTACPGPALREWVRSARHR